MFWLFYFLLVFYFWWFFFSLCIDGDSSSLLFQLMRLVGYSDLLLNHSKVLTHDHEHPNTQLLPARVVLIERILHTVDVLLLTEEEKYLLELRLELLIGLIFLGDLLPYGSCDVRKG